MKRLQLSKAAASDIREIRRYTLDHFGPMQAAKLRERLWKAFELLIEIPLSGQLRDDINPPGRPFRYRTVLKTFVIVYEPVEDGVRVARVQGSKATVRRKEPAMRNRSQSKSPW